MNETPNEDDLLDITIYRLQRFFRYEEIQKKNQRYLEEARRWYDPKYDSEGYE